MAVHGMQVVDRIEAMMRLKRFSQLGGLQLERDVRLLVSVLGEATGRPLWPTPFCFLPPALWTPQSSCSEGLPRGFRRGTLLA